MKLNNYALLKESLRTAREKYLDTERVTKGDFDELTEIDFTKTKKYLEWLCKVYLTDTSTFGAVGVRGIIDLLHKFEKASKTKYVLPSKDINTYKTIDSVKRALESFNAYSNQSRVAKKHKGSVKLFENNKCTVYYIKTKEACLLYGAHTHWCITETKGPHDHWKEYDLTNVFVFILDKADNEKKYALVFNLNTLAEDKQNYAEEQIQAFDINDTNMTSELPSILSYYGINYSSLVDSLVEVSKIDKLAEDKKTTIEKYYKGELVLNEEGTFDITNLKPFVLPYTFTNIVTGEIKVKFRYSDSDFICSDKGLISLDGCPEIVNGNFDCKYNYRLTSLEGGPEKVRGRYTCSDTSIISLEGCATEIGGTLELRNIRPLESCNGAPKTVHGLIIENASNLRSLNGLESIISIDELYLSNIMITNLVGIPFHIDRELKLIECPDLTSLEGFENTYVPNILMNYCSALRNLKGFPGEVDSIFINRCSNFESLEGLENTKINKSISISGSMNLHSLNGLPEEIFGFVSINNCAINDLMGLPKLITGFLDLANNEVELTMEMIQPLLNDITVYKGIMLDGYSFSPEQREEIKNTSRNSFTFN